MQKKDQKGGTSNHFPLILYNVLEHTKTEHINEHIRKCIDKHSPPSSKNQENHMILKIFSKWSKNSEFHQKLKFLWSLFDKNLPNSSKNVIFTMKFK